MMGRKSLPSRDVEKMRKLRRDGFSYKRIGIRLGFSIVTVMKYTRDITKGKLGLWKKFMAWLEEEDPLD